jgi:serine/threonine-protein kinase
MPFVDGESLRERLDREEQLPLEDAVRIAREVADALQHAHAQDIVHRDIKPENILLSGGHALVADFGVARAVRAAGGERLTKTGIAVGTPMYMSPEQATAHERIDARSDLYSLGCVLYEMLAGEAPLTGPTFESMVARRITETPRPLRAVRETVPVAVEEAVTRSLAKLPADRFASAEEFARALKSTSVATPPRSSTPFAALRSARTVTTAQLAAGGLLIVAAIVAAALGWLRKPPPRPITRFSLTLPTTQPLTASVGRTIALSPDGSMLVYVGDGPQLYVRLMDQLETVPIAGTEGAHSPYFSPDGEWIAFAVEGALKKVALAGGPVVTIAETPGVPISGSWGRDDNILIDSPAGVHLAQVPAAGGDLVTIVNPEPGEGALTAPWLLPGGGWALTSVGRATADEFELAVVSLETGALTRLDVNGMNPAYVPSGHLLFAAGDGTLFAAPFDARRRRITGAAVPLAENVRTKGGGVVEFTVSQNGTLVYLLATGAARRLVMVDREGLSRPLSADSRTFYGPRLSPDGRLLAVTVFEGGERDIWLYDVETAVRTRFTFEPDNLYPLWTPDGSRIVYASWRGTMDLFWKPADGSEMGDWLVRSENDLYPASLSGDGRWLAYTQTTPGSGRDVWAVPLQGDREPRPILTETYDERSPQLSPDARWLAYTSSESGRAEVFVRAFPGPGGRWQVSTEGGSEPLWSRDGRELFYRSDDRMMRALVQTDPVFAVLSEAVLFERTFVDNDFHSNYDIHPDGQRFVMVESAQTGTEVVVVLNWVDELE